ncbi:MAG TPA: type II toxin-antitoxin system VapC family toxin [Streptosporangiaceae bacterium]
MICYFDTSALVPLLIDEPSSEFCRHLWDEADDVVTTQLLYVEAAAALAQALRMGRLITPNHRTALHILDQMWAEFDIVRVNDDLVRRAAQLAQTCALRGYDAVHCASAEQLDDDDLVVASGDGKVLDACAALGLATADTNNS